MSADARLRLVRMKLANEERRIRAYAKAHPGVTFDTSRLTELRQEEVRMSLRVEEVDPAAGTYRLAGDPVLRRLPYPYEPGSLRAGVDTITATYALGAPLLPRDDSAAHAVMYPDCELPLPHDHTIDLAPLP